MSDKYLTMSDNSVIMSDMKEITLRDFLRDPKSVLPPPSEGILVRRRDGENFYLYPDVRQDAGNVRQMSDISTLPEKNGEEKKVEKRWCQLHFEKGVEYDCQLITWEDENGNPVIVDKWACPKCVKKYENMGRGKVYYG